MDTMDQERLIRRGVILQQKRKIRAEEEEQHYR